MRYSSRAIIGYGYDGCQDTCHGTRARGHAPERPLVVGPEDAELGEAPGVGALGLSPEAVEGEGRQAPVPVPVVGALIVIM